MLLIAVAWVYVVMMVAVVEATSANGTLLGALVTFVFYGLLPLGIVGYLFFSPARQRARRAAEAAEPASSNPVAVGLDPDQRGHAAGAPVAPKGEEA